MARTLIPLCLFRSAQVHRQPWELLPQSAIFPTTGWLAVSPRIEVFTTAAALRVHGGTSLESLAPSQTPDQMRGGIQQFMEGCPVGQNNQLHRPEFSAVTHSRVGSASFHPFPQSSLELWTKAHTLTASDSALWGIWAVTRAVRRVWKQQILRLWLWRWCSLVWRRAEL